MQHRSFLEELFCKVQLVIFLFLHFVPATLREFQAAAVGRWRGRGGGHYYLKSQNKQTGMWTKEVGVLTDPYAVGSKSNLAGAI